MNKPVAYVTGARRFDPVSVDTVLKVGTPLYTHPAELSDEVLEVIRAVAHIGVDFGYGEFQLDGTHVEKARAIIKASRGEDTCTPPADILRKAQEK